MARGRGIRIVLSLIALAVLVSVAGMVLLFVAVSRGPDVPDEATLVLRPGGALEEQAPADVVGQIIGSDAPTVRGLIDSLEMARRDPRISNVLLIPSGLDTPFWAKLQEVRQAILDFRTSGKKVVAFLEYGGDREYYLASAADQVVLMPTSPLDVTGVASYEVFLRGALDKVGAYPDYLHVGDYKTAVNQFTEKGFTPAHREMTTALNHSAYDQLVRGIAQSRRKSEDEVRRLIDEGPFTPGQAKAAGLVDALAYEDQLDDLMRELKIGSGEMRRVEGRDYQRTRPDSVGIRPRSRIAVLNISGTITSGRSGYSAGNGETVGSDTIVEAIRKIRADRSLKAIVVRVNSPGGSSVASDVIWRELVITRDQDASRPLITSMSDLAASGGYYVSMPAQVIVAEPGTLTGSIGVFTGKVAIGGVLNKVGVATDEVTSGRNADIYSPFTPFTPEQRVRLAAYMQAFYSTFVEKAAQGRHSTPERIHAVAQGRVWTGEQAREQGLVDELGGLDTAVRIAKQRAKIPEDEDVTLVTYPGQRSLYETITQQIGRSSLSQTLLTTPVAALLGAGAALSAEGTQMVRGQVGALATPMTLFRRGEPLALVPFTFVR